MGLIFVFTPISLSLIPNSQPPMYVHAHEPVLHVRLQSVQSFLTVPVARLHTGDDDDGEGLHGHLYVVVLPQVQTLTMVDLEVFAHPLLALTDFLSMRKMASS